MESERWQQFSFLVPSPCRVQRYFWQKPESLRVGFVWFSGSDHVIFKRLWSSTDFLVEKDNDYCVCQTPCNMTRYGKELSMVKIPSKASAKYLAKKFNKTEQYIGWVSFSSISSPDLSFFFLSVDGWVQCRMFWVSIVHLQCNDNENKVCDVVFYHASRGRVWGTLPSVLSSEKTSWS